MRNGKANPTYSLDQDLANPNAPANLSEANFHSLRGFVEASMKLLRDDRNHGDLSRPENRDTADLPFESYTFISRALRY